MLRFSNSNDFSAPYYRAHDPQSGEPHGVLIGFRNRFIVVFQWAWTYFTYQRGARLITGETPVLLGPSARSFRAADAAALPEANHGNNLTEADPKKPL